MNLGSPWTKAHKLLTTLILRPLREGSPLRFATTKHQHDHNDDQDDDKRPDPDYKNWMLSRFAMNETPHVGVRTATAHRYPSTSGRSGSPGPLLRHHHGRGLGPSGSAARHLATVDLDAMHSQDSHVRFP